jgi:hypothetical protein
MMHVFSLNASRNGTVVAAFLACPFTIGGAVLSSSS